ncbi:MAG: ATP-binding protein [Bacillota bacterium]|nr:ATP-binding protein [Bacillota bacterium]
MTKKLFKYMFLVAFVSLLATVILVMGVLYNYFSGEISKNLLNEAEYIAGAVETGGNAYLETIKNVNTNRITLIGKDGNVLFDSNADAESMENHSDRKEFIDALNTGKGEDERYSDTLSEKTIYQAVLMDDGNVLRLSATHHTLWMIVFGMLQPIVVVVAAALVLSLILAMRLSKRLLKPVNDMDLNNPDIDEEYVEFGPLLNKIKHQNIMINMQMKELRKKQDEFRVITENMSEGIIIIDNNTELLSYNSAALDLLDAEMPEEGGGSAIYLNRSEAFRKAIEEALSGKHSLQNMELKNRCLQIIANPVWADEEIHGAVLIIMDITEKEHRERLRREFTSNVSHELKTPLTSIYGMSEILMNGMVKSEDVKDFASSIHDETGRLITLINDIIKLSQLDEAAPGMEKEVVDLFDTAKSVTERLSSVAEKKNVGFELYGEQTPIEGVPSIIEEIIYNLCENAVKYNKDGGYVKIYVTNTGHMHGSIEVDDSGIGIPPEHLDRVFERFYRVDKSHSKTIGGTGLGLSIVKHGAAYHNGRIEIKSKVGEGTKIKVIL